jgi:thiol-disulfide isomerase/thioredoxin
MFRRTFLTVFFALVLSPVFAHEQAYDKASFDKLLADGKPVVVDFYADWCPTCKTQKAAIAELHKEGKLNGIMILVADYDKEKELKKQLRVSSQSTFVVFKGGKEVARSSGQTKAADIAATFAKAL